MDSHNEIVVESKELIVAKKLLGITEKLADKYRLQCEATKRVLIFFVCLSVALSMLLLFVGMQNHILAANKGSFLILKDLKEDIDYVVYSVAAPGGYYILAIPLSEKEYLICTAYLDTQLKSGQIFHVKNGKIIPTDKKL